MALCSVPIRCYDRDSVTAQDYLHYFVPLEFAGLALLIFGLIRVRRDLSFTRDGLIPLGRVFVPMALAIFAGEHFTSAKNLMQMVPHWMPARLFWTYFVGCALVAAAVSIVSGKLVRWSSPLLGVMFLIFVLSIDAPNVAAHPRDRFAWVVAVRGLLFAFGAWALAATVLELPRLAAACRIVIGLVLVFYAVEHFLHPECLPGVPLAQQTPPWIPLRIAFGYLEGAALLAAGVLLLIDRHARAAAAWLAALTTIMVILLYVPLFVVARTPMEIITAINYIGDTLLFAGCIFLLAAAIPAEKA